MADLQFHPIAGVFPLLVGDELEQLADDIRNNGLRHPIVMYEGKVLDGRNRSTACKLAGVKIVSTEFKGSRLEALAYSWSMNVARRQLNPSQAAVAEVKREKLSEEYAAEIAKAKSEVPKGGRPKKDEEKPSQQIAKVSKDDRSISGKRAKATGTNRTYLDVAKKLINDDPKTADDVLAGKKTLTQVQREQRENKRETRRQENRQKAESTPDPVKAGAKFATIVIDPPWDWGDEGDVNQLGRAKPDYATMSLGELTKLPIAKLADDDCHLYLWITNRSLPKGFELIDKWGFRYVTCLTWPKPSFGMGNYFRGQTEHILFAVKGSQLLRRKNASTLLPSWKRGPKGHSSKPAEFYEFVESCSPGPFVELFARSERIGWIRWGADA